MKNECGRTALLSDVVEKTVINYNNYLLVDTFAATIITVKKENSYFNVSIKQVNNRNIVNHFYNLEELQFFMFNYLSKYSLTILRKFFIVDLENNLKLSLIDKKEI